jgi:hypothetical protein
MSDWEVALSEGEIAFVPAIIWEINPALNRTTNARLEVDLWPRCPMFADDHLLFRFADY